MRKILVLLLSFLALAACEPPPGPALGPDGKPLPRVYRLTAADTSRVQFKMLDSVNALREASGLGTLRLNASLNAAAATHSRDMSLQNRPWHFGSDGSSPIQRVERAGYKLSMLGENISETYETELETLAAWMELDDTRQVILDPDGKDMGFAWHQDPGGKIWWTMIVGGGDLAPFVHAPSPIAELAQG